MKNTQFLNVKNAIALYSLFGIISCTQSKNEPAPVAPATSEITVQELFKLLTTSGFTYYQNNSTPRQSVAESNAHGAKVNIRFNAKAQSVLGMDGKLPLGTSFPDSSLIVKEIYDSNGNLSLYATMYRLPNDKNTFKKWVWAEITPLGVSYYEPSRGNGCTSCHSLSGNRDLVRTFGVF